MTPQAKTDATTGAARQTAAAASPGGGSPEALYSSLVDWYTLRLERRFDAVFAHNSR